MLEYLEPRLLYLLGTEGDRYQLVEDLRVLPRYDKGTPKDQVAIQKYDDGSEFVCLGQDELRIPVPLRSFSKGCHFVAIDLDGGLWYSGSSRHELQPLPLDKPVAFAYASFNPYIYVIFRGGKSGMFDLRQWSSIPPDPRDSYHELELPPLRLVLPVGSADYLLTTDGSVYCHKSEMIRKLYPLPPCVGLKWNACLVTVHADRTEKQWSEIRPRYQG